jgi:hypothetical protein
MRARGAAGRPLPDRADKGKTQVAVSQAERRRRRWRVLFAVYEATADELDRRINVQQLSTNLQIPLEAVKAIAVELSERSLVKTRGEPPHDTFRMSITAQGKAVVETASLDADHAALIAPSGVTQIEHDAHLVLRALAEYAQTADDPSPGHSDLDEIDLQGLTNLPTPRLNDAVNRLDRNGYLDGTRFLVGHALNWKGQLNGLGREAYQRLQMSGASQAVRGATSERVRTALTTIQTLHDELTSILENDPKNGDINIGLQRLRRWKIRATKALVEHVSSNEGQKFSILDTPIRSYLVRDDGHGNRVSVQLENEVQLYGAFLVALAEHLEQDGEAALTAAVPQHARHPNEPPTASASRRQTPRRQSRGATRKRAFENAGMMGPLRRPLIR